MGWMENGMKQTAATVSFKETRDDSMMIAFLKLFFFLGGGWSWIHKGFYQ